jgi:hypothetical protein
LGLSVGFRWLFVTGICFFFFFFFFFGFCTPLNRGAGAIFFWLFVPKMTIQQDDDVLPSGFLLANAAGVESGGQPEVVR